MINMHWDRSRIQWRGSRINVCWRGTILLELIMWCISLKSRKKWREDQDGHLVSFCKLQPCAQSKYENWSHDIGYKKIQTKRSNSLHTVFVSDVRVSTFKFFCQKSHITEHYLFQFKGFDSTTWTTPGFALSVISLHLLEIRARPWLNCSLNQRTCLPLSSLSSILDRRAAHLFKPRSTEETC